MRCTPPSREPSRVFRPPSTDGWSIMRWRCSLGARNHERVRRRRFQRELTDRGGDEERPGRDGLEIGGEDGGELGGRSGSEAIGASHSGERELPAHREWFSGPAVQEPRERPIFPSVVLPDDIVAVHEQNPKLRMRALADHRLVGPFEAKTGTVLLPGRVNAGTTRGVGRLPGDPVSMDPDDVPASGRDAIAYQRSSEHDLVRSQENNAPPFAR